MAWWDPESETVWLQVVYDGLAGAGKSTNLQALAEHFADVREGELLCPLPGGRNTVYFDCLRLRAGLTRGRRTRLQVLSVPGQVVWSERRWTLLSYADAVVLVCDASAPLEHSKLALDFLREASPSPLPPFVIQLNKRDRPNATPAGEFATALGLDAGQLHLASAHERQGVVQTLLAAVTLARLSAEQALDARGPEGLRRGEPDPDALLAELTALADSPALLTYLERRERVLARWAARLRGEAEE